MNATTHPPIDFLGLPIFWQEGVLSQVHLGENVLAWLEVDLNEELSFKKTLVILTDQRVISTDEAQKNWRDSLLAKFDNFVTANDTKVKALQDKIEESAEASDKSYVELIAKISAILEKVESIEESNETNHTFIEDQMEQIIDTRKKMKQTIEKIAIYFGALVSVIGIIMTLMQLNILNITWGHK
jgi:hypothetical protein